MRRFPLSTPVSLHRGGVRRRLAQTTALAGMLAAAPALGQTLPNPGGNPVLPDNNVVRVVLPGAATFTTTTSAVAGEPTQTLTVNVLVPSTVIDWNTFDIGATERANFTNGVALAPNIAVVNRVRGAAFDDVGVTQSQILGNLRSDPTVSVYLINPTGILFGAGSVVNVGSLIASTRGLASGDVGDPAALQFVGASTGAVEVLSGAQITASAASRGIVALIGARIDTAGAISASGDVALVAADDTTISFDGASPLAVTITAGTALSNPIVARNTITGSSILLAGATRAGVIGGLLDVQATMTATSAYASDQGIVLAAGPTTSTAPTNVQFGSGRGTDTTGAVSLRLGDSLTSNGAAGAIDIRAGSGVTAPIVVAPATTALPPAGLSADQGILVRAETGGIALGNAFSRLVSTTAFGIDMTAGAGAISAGDVSAGVAAPGAPGSTGARALVTATAGSVTIGSLFASQDAAISGTTVSLGVVQAEAAALGITATAGSITGASLTAGTGLTALATGGAITADSLTAGAALSATATGGAITANTLTGGTGVIAVASGDLIADGVTSQASNADLIVSAVNVLGRAGPRAVLSAGQDLSVTATGTATLGASAAGRAASLSATAIDGTTLSAGTTLGVTATTGTLAFGGTTSGGTTTLSAATSATVTGTVLSTGGAIDVDGASVNLGGANANTALDVTSSGTTLVLGSGIAGGAATIAAATTANVDALSAGTNASLAAGTIATLTGNASAGNDLLVSGTAIRLGGTAGAVQVAGRTASYTASTGTITGTSGATGLVIRADNAGAGTGAIILDANTSIDTTGIGLVTGVAGSTTNSGDVGIRIATAAAPLTLGTVDARALLSVNAAHTIFSPLSTGGAVTFGGTRLVNGLALSTPGTISLAGIAVSGPGQTLSVTGTGPSNTITTTGALSAPGGVTVRAPGAVQLTGVNGGTGATILESTSALLNATGTLTGGTVSARAAAALTAAGTITATSGGIDARGTSVSLNVANAATALDVTSTATTLGLQTGTAGTTATLNAATNATIGTVDASRIVAIIGDTLGATRLTATQTSTATDALSVTADVLTVTTAQATNADARLTSTIGEASVTSLSVGRDGILNAATTATLAGGGTIGRDLIVSGTNVRLGGTAGEQSAGRNADFTARTGTIAALSGGAITVRGDAAGAGTGRIILDANTGIALAGSALVTGVSGGTTNSGDVAVRLATAAAPLVLGTVDARSLLSVNAAHTVFSPFATTGAVTLGVTRLINSLTLSTPGTISLAGVAISGPAQMLSISGSGAATTVTSTGALSAPGTVTVNAPGAVTLTGVSGSSVTLTSTNAALTAGAVTASNGNVAANGESAVLGAVTATGGAIALSTDTTTLSTGALLATGEVRAVGNTVATIGSANSTGANVFLVGNDSLTVNGAINARTFVQAGSFGTTSLQDVTAGGFAELASVNGSLTAGAVTSADFVSATAGTSVQITSVTDTGTAASTLAANGGALTMLGATSVGGSLTATGTTAVTMGNVTSTGGAVTLTAGTVLNAAAVLAEGALSATGGTSTTLTSARSRTSSVTLTSPGTVTVGGPTQAVGAISSTATGSGSVAMGAVTSTGGTVLLRSTNAAVGAGAVSANGQLTAAAGTNATLGSAASALANISLTAQGTLSVTNGVEAQTGIVTQSGGAQALGNVTSRAGTVSLEATGGTLGVAGLTQARGNVGIGARDAITLAAINSDLGTVTIASGLGTVGATTLTAAGAIDVAGPAGVSLTSATSSGSSVSVRATVGTIGATTLDAATNVTAAGRDGLTLSTVNARGLLGGVPSGGSATLSSSAGAITLGSVTTRTTLDATAATTLTVPTATIGTIATLAGRDVTLGTIGADVLRATANLGDLTITAADVAGEATLAKTGATGAISIARLTAGGPTQITSAGAVRADLLEGGATTVNAVGNISGRTGGLNATVSSLTVNSTAGSATIGAVTTTGSTNVSAAGATLLTGAIAAQGDLVARGGSVTLGRAGTPIDQVAAGQVQVTSTAGVITGLSGLTLRSNNGGVAGAGRDLTLQSAGGITFGSDTRIAGGPDRQSALRLGAASGATIALDSVAARTILSVPAGATRLSHDGPVSIVRAATAESLDIALTGAANPLTINTVEVRAGNLSLDAGGALTTGPVGVAAGTTTLAGATVTSGAITTRSLIATARTGAAIFTTIGATAGGIAATAATDLQLTDATATGPVALAAGANVRLTSVTTAGAVSVTSAGGDVTGNAIAGGFAPTTLTSSGGVVTVRANATDGTRGAILVGAVAGRGGVDLAGRAITAESLASAAGAVTASTARDLAGLTSQPMTIGTIDAAGTITLSTGNRTVASSAPLALDRATSTGGNIAITTIGGGLAARGGSPRTILSAPAGTITLDIGGAAILDSASGRAVAITGTSLDVATATATAGALALTTRGGPLVLGTGTASGAATLNAVGPITVANLTAGSATLTGTAGATLGTVQTTVGDLGVTVTGLLDAITLDSARGIAVDAGSARITDANARGTTLALTTRTGALQLVTGRAATDATLSGPTLSIGTLDTGGAGTLTTPGGLIADRLTISTALTASADTATITTIDAGSAALTAATDLLVTTTTTRAALTAAAGQDATLTTVNGGGDTRLSAGRTLTVGSVTTPALLTLVAPRIDVATLATGSLDITGGLNGIDLRDSTVTGAAAIASDADLALGTFTGGSADLRAVTTLAADTLDIAGALAARAGTITITDLTAGSLGADAGTGGFDLETGTVANAARIASGAALTFGTLNAGSADLSAATDLVGPTLSVGDALVSSAGRDLQVTTVTAGGDAALSATRTLTVGNVTTPAALTLTGGTIAATTLDTGSLAAMAGAGGLTLDTGTVARFAALTSGADIGIGTLQAGTIDINAAGALTADLLAASNGLSIVAASAQVTTTRVTGGTTRIRTGDEGLVLDDLVTAGGLDVLTTGVLTSGTLDIGGRLDATGASASFADTRATGGAALTTTVGSLTIGQATIGGATTLIGATDVSSTRLVVGGALGVTAGGTTSLVDAEVQSDTSVIAGTITIGRLATPAQLTLAARQIAAGTTEAGTLAVRAGVGGADLRTTTVTGAADLASDADLTLGTLNAGATKIVAAGTFAADTLSARERLDVTASTARMGRTTVSGGPATLTATAGDLTLGSATVGGAATLTAAGTLAADALDVAGDLSGTAAAIRVTTTTVRAGNAGLTARNSGITLGTATIAGDATLSAIGLIDAGTLAAGRTLGASGGSIALRQASAGGAATLTARDATLAIGEGRFAANAALSARSGLTADLLTVGTTLGVTADTIGLGTATIGRDAALTARNVTLGSFATTSGALTLAASGAATADTLRIGGRLTSTSGALTARSTTVIGDASLTGGSVTLTNASVGGSAAIDVTGRASADTLDVGGRLTAATPTLVLGNATVRGGPSTLTVGTAEIGQLTTSGATGITARGALTANRLDASAITANAAFATIGQAAARAGDIALTTTGGDIRLATATASGAVGLTSSGASAVTGAVTAGTNYRIDATAITLGAAGTTARQAGADVALVARTGAVTTQGSTTIVGTRTVAITARGTGGAITLVPETTIISSASDVTLATTGAAALGTVTGATAIRVDATDAALTRALTAPTVTLTNVAASGVTRLGDTGVGNETEFAAPATRFDLTSAEVNLIAAPTLTIASGARDVVLGTVALGAATGSTRFAITATGRVDMLGRFVAAGSTASRTIAIGNDASGATARTSVIRVASTQADGGRLLVDGAGLELSADRIGAGLDRDFLTVIGYRAATGLPVEQVAQQYVARPTSTLYTPGALGAIPYTDTVLVRAGSLRLTYGQYALFQNTGLPGQQTGVILGTAGATGAASASLRLSTPNSTSNAFALFGTIDGISSQATALLGSERLQIGAGVSPVASRINGCIIGSGGGCLNTSIAQPSLNLFDTSRAEIVRTADDLTLPFDPLIGTNNEALYLDSVADSTAPRCEGDQPCPTQP